MYKIALRNGRRLLLAFALLGLATAWYLSANRPPLPLASYRFRSTPSAYASCRISPNGRTAIIESDNNLPNDHEPSIWTIHTYELPSGIRRATFHYPKADRGLISPDGTKIKYWDATGNRKIHLLPDGTVIASIPYSGGVDYGIDEEWSPDGRHLIINCNEGIAVYETAGWTIRNKWPLMHHLTFIPDGSGLVGISADDLRVEIWKFGLSEKVDSIALPQPDLFHLLVSLVNGNTGQSLTELAVSNDGTTVAVLLERHVLFSNDYFVTPHIEVWDRRIGKWSGLNSKLPPFQSAPGMFGRIDAIQLQLAHDGCQLVTFAQRQNWLNNNKNKPNENLWFFDRSVGKYRKADSITGLIMIDPTGQRILSSSDRKYSIHSSETRMPIKSASVETCRVPVFSPDGHWLSLTIPFEPPTLPNWVPQFVYNVLPAQRTGQRLVRLSDGNSMWDLPDEGAEVTFTNDGQLWTVQEQYDREKNTHEFIVHRWPTDSPGTPWWLWLLTAGGAVGMIYEIRQGRRKR